MHRNIRTLSLTVFAVVLLLSVTACKKKVAAAPPPAPAPAVAKVEAPPPPPAAARIASFTVEPNSIQRGQAATLAWSVANATDIAIDNGVGAVQANGMAKDFSWKTSAAAYVTLYEAARRTRIPRAVGTSKH